ncbi:uncharacterized protein N7511_010685 [Penicillium nucicola]|uniref:uncharacterized protein n=1 Tax=Penicillium nucicola TaxID=1850975 RepID=UPI002545A8A5|nr:uncharacterized protein N7511_010685 [Penicillium nucicola]KAJ5748989.1 hypothetical protein N7511_010685 [Penicillium nucicola]
MTADPWIRPSETTRRTIGPLDKRKTTTRCQLCANRRVKCDGRSPCERCVRTKKTCVPQYQQQPGIKFIHVSGHALSSTIPMQVRKHDDAIYLEHFASFIQRCHFSEEFAATNTDIVTIIGKYPLILQISIAIGALDASRKGSSRSFGALQSPQYVAFRACGRSLQDLHSAVSTANPVFRDDVLWSTFLHGIFELMAEDSGNSFAKHMAFGTSKLLLLLETRKPLPLPTESLIDAFWILETNRAILYGDMGFNAEKLAKSHEGNSHAHDKNIHICKKASQPWKLFDEIESIPQMLRPFDPRVHRIAIKGLEIKESLLNWQQRRPLERLPLDPFNQLAVIIHRALLLYHCWNFTFYSCWMTRVIPQLEQSEVCKHVATILDLSQSLLSDTFIPGLLILFPLRMAGVHTSESRVQQKVLDTIRNIQNKGFMASNRIEADLQEFWRYESK